MEEHSDSLFAEDSESSISFLDNFEHNEIDTSPNKNTTFSISMNTLNEEESKCTVFVNGPTTRMNLLDHVKRKEEKRPVKSFSLSVLTNVGTKKSKGESLELTLKELQLLHRVLGAYLALVNPDKI